MGCLSSGSLDEEEAEGIGCGGIESAGLPFMFERSGPDGGALALEC